MMNPPTQPPPVVVDARPLFASGQSPCSVIDQAVHQLAPGQPLILLVPFEPFPLYEKLGRFGFTHHSTCLPDGDWQIEFQRPAPLTPLPEGSIACGCSHTSS